MRTQMGFGNAPIRIVSILVIFICEMSQAPAAIPILVPLPRAGLKTEIFINGIAGGLVGRPFHALDSSTCVTIVHSCHRTSRSKRGVYH